MRRLWTGVSRLRLSVVVAAIFATARAPESCSSSARRQGRPGRARRSLRLQLGLGVTALAGLVALTATVAAARETTAAASATLRSTTVAVASGRCSKSTAVQVATRLHVGVDPTTGKTPIAQVLCGPFLGRGSRGMVASVAIPSCGVSITWAVFRYAAGHWMLVMKLNHGAFLSKVGSDIREKIGVLRPDDSHCFPSAWKTRIWHWNGRRFTHTGWKVTQARPSFLSPDRKVWCSIYDDGSPMFCTTGDPPGTQHSATLKRNGDLAICTDYCTQNWDTRAPLLRYGQKNERSGFRCISAMEGITCTVISGVGKGKGFLINAATVTPIGP
jgi:hypothetical protein